LQQSVAFFDTASGAVLPPSRHEPVQRRGTAPRLASTLSPAPVRGGGSSNFRPY